LKSVIFNPVNGRVMARQTGIVTVPKPVLEDHQHCKFSMSP